MLPGGMEATGERAGGNLGKFPSSLESSLRLSERGGLDDRWLMQVARDIGAGMTREPPDAYVARSTSRVGV